ncbi:squalene synthase HpnC [Stakelama sediminis]|nr:squalene synthase HpnC [Stakelama sediminis]
MTAEAAQLASGKGHRDENFPVASHLVKPAYRAPIMAFYRFARAADDVADNPDAAPEEKLRLLDAMREGVMGRGDNEEALALHHAMAERDLDPGHACDLLDAFTHDVTINRYADWGELIGYCRLSAMPVGRYVLDVHGESRTLWPASDALCAALQVINHLQDCGKDYRTLNRVYIPSETLAETGGRIEDLGGAQATQGLLAAIRHLAAKTDALLEQSAGFAASIRDSRLAGEVAVIHGLAVSLNKRLHRRDPLSQRVHHTRPQAAMLATGALLKYWLRWPR